MTPKMRTTLFRLLGPPGRRLMCVAAVAMVNLCIVSGVQAQVVWDGGGLDNNWGTGGNWDNNTAPGNPSGSILQFGGTTRLAPNVNANWQVNGLQFNSGAGAFVIGGSTITIAAASGIVNNDDTVQTINNALTLSFSQTWNAASGGLTLGGAVALNAATLTLSGAYAIAVNGTLTQNGSRTITNNNSSGSVTFGAITLSSSNTNRTLTVNGTGNTTISGAITNGGTSTSGLTKSGTSTLTISGASNSYTGVTTISGGTLSVGTLANGGSNSSIGASSNAAANLVINGGTLKYTGAAATSNRRFTLGTSGGSIDASGSGLLTLSNTNAVTLSGTNTARTITLSGSGSGTLAAQITNNGTGATAVTKNGTGTWTLSNASTSSYTGVTTISGGTLAVAALANIGSASPIGVGVSTNAVTNAASLVINGGTLQYTGAAVTSNRLFTLGTSGGTVDASGTGQLTLSNTNSIALSGTNTARTLTLAGTGTGSLASAIGDNGTGATALTKSGTGTWTVSGTNTFTGAVTVGGTGTLIAASNSALGSGTSASHSVGSGASLALSGSGLNVNTNGSSISIAGDGVSNKGAIYNVSGTNTLDLGNAPSGGSITLTSAARLGSEAGTLVIGDTRPSFTHPGGHTVPTESGYITLGNSSVSNNLTFSGSGNITVNASIRDYSGQTVGTSFVNSSTINYQPVAPTTTTGNVTINMGTNSSTVTFAANGNSYKGTTYVTRGTLVLDTLNNNNVAPHDTTNDSFHAINGNLVIGNGGGTATVQFSTSAGFGPHEPLAISTGVTLYSDGTLNLNGNTQTINTLTFVNGGTVNVGNNGTLYLNNSVNFTPTSTGNVSATIGTADGQRGSLSLELKRNSPVDDALPAVDRQFTVTNFDGSSTSTLTVNSVVKAGSVTKLGDGVLVFAGGGTISTNNTYTGTTTVSAGILRGTAGTAGSYSSFGSGDGSDAMGTTVANGATVQLSGGINVSSEKLNLNGNGYNSAGALQNLSGNNTWGTAGSTYINLVTDSRINADSGTTLTIPSNITSTGNNKALTVGGTGDTTISGSINTGSGSTTTLTKDGTGTLSLSGSSGYQGKTDITAGIVRALSNGALGAGSVGTDGTFVTSGAQLQLSGGISLSDTMSINGTGVSGTGAIRNYAGSNSIAGAITFATTARVYNDVASNTLTLAGGLKTSGSSGIDMNFAGSQNITVSGDSGTGSGGSASGKTIDAGSSTLTKGNTGTDTGTLSLTLTGTTNQVGQVHMNYGGIAVNSGQLNTAEFDSLSGTTLTIGAGAAVVANYASGTTIFSGAITASGASATFQKTGSGTLVFGSTFDAGSNSVLKLSGGTLKLGNTSGVNVTFGTIHITADTTIDFNGSYTTTLTSLSLIIDAGVNVSVINWTSLADAWYVNGVGTPTINGANFGTLGDQMGVTPLNQITFTGIAANTATTWVSTQGGQYFNREIRPTPEPATYGAIFLGACLALLGYRRYRRSAARR